MSNPDRAEGFELGDVVCLKSEPGVHMTVSKIDRDYGVVDVRWFSGSEIRGSRIHAHELRKVNEED